MNHYPNIVHTPVPGRCDCHVGDVIDGRYTVTSVLGEGSFGIVYKVVDAYQRPWAMKLLRLWDVPSSIRQPLIERFDMEYKTGCISSRNLVHSVGIGYLLGNPYIVMEFCPNGDLKQYIGQHNAPLDRIALDILNGLNDLHSNGKVHRDLKPENVLFKADGTAVLTDFGISGDRNKRMTERNIFGKPTQIFGTYAYMPPEQVNRARGNSTVLPTTDLFSFGVVMYQLITGKLPFGRLEDENDLVHYQKRGNAGDWDRLSLSSSTTGRRWERLIASCLEPNLKNRIQSAMEAMNAVPQTPFAERMFNPIGIVNRMPKAGGNSYLKVMQGLEFGKRYDLNKALKDSGRRLLTVGREKVNSIVLSDYAESYVSRHHCSLEIMDDNSWLIRDGQWDSERQTWLFSTNGTYVNSREVKKRGLVLQDRDIITVGDIKLRFETDQ